MTSNKEIFLREVADMIICTISFQNLGIAYICCSNKEILCEVADTVVSHTDPDKTGAQPWGYIMTFSGMAIWLIFFENSGIASVFYIKFIPLGSGTASTRMPIDILRTGRSSSRIRASPCRRPLGATTTTRSSCSDSACTASCICIRASIVHRTV